jgi:hypothetical protein
MATTKVHGVDSPPVPWALPRLLRPVVAVGEMSHLVVIVVSAVVALDVPLHLVRVAVVALDVP